MWKITASRANEKKCIEQAGESAQAEEQQQSHDYFEKENQ